LPDGLDLQTRPRKASYDVVVVGRDRRASRRRCTAHRKDCRRCSWSAKRRAGRRARRRASRTTSASDRLVRATSLATRALSQAQRFGAELSSRAASDSLELSDDAASTRSCSTAANACRTRTVILANGVSWRELDVPGAEALVGRGIYYGAAQTEAQGCQGSASS
jgi:thioredoxin reductase (NADPH)